MTFREAGVGLRAGNPAGVFFSRGPVLWILRTAKLSEWYATHRWCGDSGDA